MITIALCIIGFGLALGIAISVAFLIILRAGKADAHDVPPARVLIKPNAPAKRSTPPPPPTSPHITTTDTLHSEPQSEYRRKSSYWTSAGITPPERCTGYCNIFHGPTHRQCTACGWDDL